MGWVSADPTAIAKEVLSLRHSGSGPDLGRTEPDPQTLNTEIYMSPQTHLEAENPVPPFHRPNRNNIVLGLHPVVGRQLRNRACHFGRWFRCDCCRPFFLVGFREFGDVPDDAKGVVANQAGRRRSVVCESPEPFNNDPPRFAIRSYLRKSYGKRTKNSCSLLCRPPQNDPKDATKGIDDPTSSELWNSSCSSSPSSCWRLCNIEIDLDYLKRITKGGNDRK